MTADKPIAKPPQPLVIAEDEVILALDCLPLLGPDGPLPLPGAVHRSLSNLGPELLAEVQPTRVMLPLFAAGYDAMAAVEELERLGYAGMITVIAPDLPRPRLVERELRASGPGLRLSLVSP